MGQPGPAFVTIVRMPGQSRGKQGVSSSSRLAPGGKSEALQVTAETDHYHLQFTIDAQQQRITVLGREFDCAATNLLLLDGRSAGEPTSWPSESHFAMLPGIRDSEALRDALLLLPPVQTFLAKTA